MPRRPLGRTGIEVSVLSLGTVELGMEYGIGRADERAKPARADSIALLEHAVAAGINLFDTAPSYGDSERLLGEVLGPRTDCYIATKVEVPRDGAGQLMEGGRVFRAVRDSLERSLANLKRETLDVVQIHNATTEVIRRSEIADALSEAREEGLLRFIGASVYGEEAALAVVESGQYSVLQLAYNLLDQRMAARVLPAAHTAGIGTFARSALLKGVLTSRARTLDGGLSPLRTAAARAVESLAGSWAELPRTALRFCLSNSAVDTVLVGARNQSELMEALAGVSEGELSAVQKERAKELALEDERLADPSQWEVR
jgi:aryl-alcohol dehydrogenase-like predicted oxidoreductase